MIARLSDEWGHAPAFAAPAAAVAALLLEQLAQGDAPRVYDSDAGIDTVIKLGGSLERAGLLEFVGEGLASLVDEGRRVLVVPGGGRFADAARALCAEHDPGKDTAHWWGVAAMDRLAGIVARVLPRGELVTDADQARAAATAGRLPVLAPFAWLREADPLPHSWDVTGDSIAAWVAGQVGARRLVLVKSVEPPPLPIEDLARQGVVDAYFPSIVPPGVEVEIVDGHALERLRAVVMR